MLSYVQDSLTRFRHARTRKFQDQLYPHVKQTYGAKTQYTTDAGPSPLLTHAQKNRPGGHYNLYILRPIH